MLTRPLSKTVKNFLFIVEIMSTNPFTLEYCPYVTWLRQAERLTDMAIFHSLQIALPQDRMDLFRFPRVIL